MTKAHVRYMNTGITQSLEMTGDCVSLNVPCMQKNSVNHPCNEKDGLIMTSHPAGD